MTQPAKHTPGPWTARKAPERNAYAWDVEGAQGTVPTIARMALVDRVSEVEANAHLIAAAPAMYEALQMVATTLYDMADSAGDVPEWNESGELYELSRTVRAALAQAEGR